MRVREIEAAGLRGRMAVASGTLLLALVLLMATAASSRAEVAYTESLPNGVQRTTYRIGPIEVTPGQNRINLRPIVGSARPSVDGWITRIKPDLVYEDGSIPKSSLVMFHHGVWVNASNGFEPFFATGEEKTILDLPEGFGYRYRAGDVWVLNDMIHNLTPEPMSLYATYEIDFIPDTAPEAENVVQARPLWMDVERSIYPVFDVHRGSGGKDGEFTFPQDAPNAYPPGDQKNVKTINQDGMLVWTTGHVHTGGLSTNLYLRREGASYAGPKCPKRVSYDRQLRSLRKKQARFNAKVKQLKQRASRLARGKKSRPKARASQARRQVKAISKRIANVKRMRAVNQSKLAKVEAKDRTERKRDAACRGTQPRVNDGNRVHLFDSGAKYFDPRGPISWDMAMFSTGEDWRVRVKAGDELEIQTTYETKIASWPESMGINVVYWVHDSDLAAAADSPNPYETKVDRKGVLNHGHYPENEDYGGETGKNGSKLVGPDPTKLGDGPFGGGPFTIADYSYGQGDFRLPGSAGRPPVVNQGQSFTFKLSDFDVANEVWHSLTSCKAPCNKSTGISYPIPDGEFQFESGQMGPGIPPTVGYTEWSTPDTLKKGTYTYFCRIHPLMRGAFRVK